jgi:hypothetical protein
VECFDSFEVLVPFVMARQVWSFLKGKCALGPFLSILVIECQHKCLSVKVSQVMDKVQIKSKGMYCV